MSFINGNKIETLVHTIFTDEWFNFKDLCQPNRYWWSFFRQAFQFQCLWVPRIIQYCLTPLACLLSAISFSPALLSQPRAPPRRSCCLWLRSHRPTNDELNLSVGGDFSIFCCHFASIAILPLWCWLRKWGMSCAYCAQLFEILLWQLMSKSNVLEYICLNLFDIIFPQGALRNPFYPTFCLTLLHILTTSRCYT